ncbi:hypothetical protein Nepgr_025044 [Nepenthes gracilis]|uniref:Uncharacterized protein n=1 Tax=Nepenthes gracilis TaxID=150966 RepID=A0AAD3T5Z1_NEPGR|nr:hypothetical protein Nepgr_025044 [Nepenthes gracilis]
MAPLFHPVNNLELKILPVSPSAYSANPNTKSLKAPVAIGSAISLVPNVHARSIVRTLNLGSLSMFRDYFWDLEYRIQAAQLDLKNLVMNNSWLNTRGWDIQACPYQGRSHSGP